MYTLIQLYVFELLLQRISYKICLYDYVISDGVYPCFSHTNTLVCRKTRMKLQIEREVKLVHHYNFYSIELAFFLFPSHCKVVSFLRKDNYTIRKKKSWPKHWNVIFPFELNKSSIEKSCFVSETFSMAIFWDYYNFKIIWWKFVYNRWTMPQISDWSNTGVVKRQICDQYMWAKNGVRRCVCVLPQKRFLTFNDM